MTTTPAPQPVSVLVVDDNPAKRLALRAALAPLAATIIEADSGRAALRCVMECDFAVILLDVKMPGMSGYETAQLIRQRDHSASTPIIFVTSFDRHELPPEEGYDMGGVDFITPPVVPGILRAKVTVFMQLFANARELQASNEQRQRLLTRLVTLQEDERRRIAGNIHDDALQSIVVAKMRLNRYQRGRVNDPDQGQLTQVETCLVEAITRMRGLMTDLLPAGLDSGLEAAVRERLEHMRDSEGNAFELTSAIASEPDATTRGTLYRIAQEALTNVVKHADGAAITVRISDHAHGFLVRIADQGPGLPWGHSGESPEGHMGLTSMRERAEALAGWWTIGNGDAGGVVVEYWLPRPSRRAADAAVVPSVPNGTAVQVAR